MKHEALCRECNVQGQRGHLMPGTAPRTASRVGAGDRELRTARVALGSDTLRDRRFGCDWATRVIPRDDAETGRLDKVSYRSQAVTAPTAYQQSQQPRLCLVRQRACLDLRCFSSSHTRRLKFQAIISNGPRGFAPTARTSRNRADPFQQEIRCLPSDVSATAGRQSVCLLGRDSDAKEKHLFDTGRRNASTTPRGSGGKRYSQLYGQYPWLTAVY